MANNKKPRTPSNAALCREVAHLRVPAVPTAFLESASNYYVRNVRRALRRAATPTKA